MLRLLLLLIALTAVAACSPSRSYESLDLMAKLASGEMPEALDRRRIAFDGGGSLQQGDLYRPVGETAGAGLLVMPGASPRGRDDPRVIAFAATWAEAGFLVLVPEVPNLRVQQVAAADAEIMAASLRYLEAEMAGRPVGGLALSYAAGPMLLASLEPDLAQDIDFLIVMGGYYDTQSVTTYFTTGKYREREGYRWRHLEPDPFGTWIFVSANASRLESAGDQRRMAAIAQRRAYDQAAPIDDLTQGLGPEGRSVLAFLENDDPERAPQLYAALPAPIRREMEALNLANQDLSGPGPELLLLHGKEDRVIPYTESIALKEAVNAGGSGRASLTLLERFDHTELENPLAGDVARLASLLYRVLAYRDAGLEQGAAGL